MRNSLTKLGIDWSNASTFLMLWFVLSFIALGLIAPHHGGWNRRVDWSMYTNKTVPGWFPIPLFHVDPDKRGWESRPNLPPIYFAFGVTTHAEYANGRPSFRARVRSGAVVDVDRDQVVVMPFDLSERENLLYDFVDLEGAPQEVDDRFPVRADGMIEPGSPGSTLPYPHVWMQSHTRYNDGTWAESWIIVLPDGTVQPGDATLHLRSLSQAAAFGMAKAAFFGAIVAFFGTWILQAMSRVIKRNAA